ncbi:MAG: hypothetical protein KDC98_22460 [Planctomycetes bacterium]|nr:hypothetical protein [Planctomycetota bacterium]
MRTALLSVLTAACATIPAQYPPDLVLPPRSPQAVTGSSLRPQLSALSLAEREVVLWHEFAAGNVPTFLRTLVPITTQAVIQGTTRHATFWCTRDYVGIGTDADWFRMPMTPTLAQQLADRLECVLPTRRMVDAIWTQAQVRLAPFPYSPSVYDILSSDLFHQHHLQIESQRGTASQLLLVAGIKKDVVASARIATAPGRVCIYGWHYLNGTPIQPLYSGHTFGHVDYSHGIRLVARSMEVDGVRTTVDAVLADPLLNVLLSDEGPFASFSYPTGTAESFPLHDTFPATGPELTSWRYKFTAPTTVAAPANPAPPSGAATVLRVMDRAGGTDTLRLDPGLVTDLGFEADLLCEHRPWLASDGFERVGVFVRDRAGGAFDGTLSQQGACYALTWDSHDGRVRCLRAMNGQVLDLLPAARLLPGTAWRRFRIEAAGAELAFYLDGERPLTTPDAVHARGAFGIGYHEYFATNANMRGTRVDSCHADVPGAFAVTLRPGPQPGLMQLRRRRGIPGDVCFTAVTVIPGAFPNGWFFGLDPRPGDLLAQFASGHPAFLGVFDGDGRHDFAIAGLPLGLALQAVAIELDPSLRHWQVAAPVAVQVR